MPFSAIKRIVPFLFLFAALVSIANALPRASNVPGGVAIVNLGAFDPLQEKPFAWFRGQPVWVSKQGQQWVAVVGLPLNLPVGIHELRVSNQGDSGIAFRHTSFEVHAKHYPAQHITLKDTSRITLSEANRLRASAEIERIRKLRHHWHAVPNLEPRFAPPVQGRLTGRFGVRRFFNGEERNPHNGLDIAVPLGTPVKAMADGVVIDTGDYFFNGKTVFIDHGNGLISMVCHLDRIDVQTGETVALGQKIGLAGMTGRASGPHVHLSVILNGTMVDPELFVDAALPSSAN